MLEPAVVQGNITRGYPLPQALFLFVHFGSPTVGRAALEALRPRLTTGAEWEPGRRPTATLNVALSAAGLAALGLPAEVLDSFPEEFRQDMASRSRQLGDAEADHPANWAPEWRRSAEIHALVSIYAQDQTVLDAERERLLGEPWATGVTVVVEERGGRLPGGTEHFGFADGLSQPVLAGVGGPTPTPAGRSTLATGEILLGHLDGEGFLPPSPRPGVLAHDGTFLVFRKLSQDVDAYQRFRAERGRAYPGGPPVLEAKVMGRWPDGRPLARPSVTEETLDFADDPDGTTCPVGAHIRRANPRRGLGADRQDFFDRHRMLRRGIPYTTPTERGLLFQCLCASIGRQFEFVQSQWLNDGNALGLGDERDVIAGSHPEVSGGHMTVPGDAGAGRPLWVVPRVPRLVSVRGGAYFFVPSMVAVRWLTQGTWAHPAVSPRMVTVP
ncbi:MAG: Dyp-type peroxidase [Acidimicrobiales bacterium]